jgi:hypothetical protein
MVPLAEQVLTTKQSEALVDISTDADLKDNIQNLPLINFWAGVMEFPHISTAAVKLLPFAPKYLCESILSILNNKDKMPQ